MSMLDSLFGVQRIFINGVELITRKAVNIVAGVGQLSAADNPTEARSDITIGFPTAAAAPTTGAHVRGEIVLNSAPSASGTIGWVCVTSRTPGVWKTFGAIAS